MSSPVTKPKHYNACVRDPTDDLEDRYIVYSVDYHMSHTGSAIRVWAVKALRKGQLER